MKRLFLASILVSLLVVSSAWGVTFTLNKAALMMLWQVYENPITSGNPSTGDLYVTDNPTTYGVPMQGVVGFVGDMYDPGNPPNTYSPFAQMQIGANFWGSSGAIGTSGATTAQVIGAALGTAPTNSLVGFDSFDLILHNDNDDIWMVNIFLNTGYTDVPWNEPDNYYENGWTALGPYGTASLSVDLTSAANLNHVTNIGLNVGANLTNVGGNPSNPDTFHVSTAPIPEPSTLILLGFGFLGLCAYGWRKKKQS
jgi:hypothetical protein